MPQWDTFWSLPSDTVLGAAIVALLGGLGVIVGFCIRTLMTGSAQGRTALRAERDKYVDSLVPIVEERIALCKSYALASSPKISPGLPDAAKRMAEALDLQEMTPLQASRDIAHTLLTRGLLKSLDELTETEESYLRYALELLKDESKRDVEWLDSFRSIENHERRKDRLMRLQTRIGVQLLHEKRKRVSLMAGWRERRVVKENR